MAIRARVEKGGLWRMVNRAVICIVGAIICVLVTAGCRQNDSTTLVGDLRLWRLDHNQVVIENSETEEILVPSISIEGPATIDRIARLGEELGFVGEIQVVVTAERGFYFFLSNAGEVRDFQSLEQLNVWLDEQQYPIPRPSDYRSALRVLRRGAL
jgi:hypothetical protein